MKCIINHNLCFTVKYIWKFIILLNFINIIIIIEYWTATENMS